MLQTKQRYGTTATQQRGTATAQFLFKKHSQTKYSAYDREFMRLLNISDILERQNFYWSQITNLSFTHSRGNQIRCRQIRHHRIQ